MTEEKSLCSSCPEEHYKPNCDANFPCPYVSLPLCHGEYMGTDDCFGCAYEDSCRDLRDELEEEDEE